jgi:hypothetical protein
LLTHQLFSLGCDIGYGLLHRVPRSTDGVVKKTVVKIPQEHLQPTVIHSVSPSQTQPTEPSSSASVIINTVSIPPSDSNTASTITPLVTLVYPTPTAPSSLSDIPTASVPLVSYVVPSTSNTTIFTPAAPFTPSTLFSSTSAPSIAQSEAPTPLTSIPPTLPTPSLPPAVPSGPTTTTAPALSSVEALQKQLEALRVQNQKIQEMRSKQMAAGSSSGLPTSTSSPSVGSAVPQITAQALAALKIQALAAKQQQ